MRLHADRSLPFTEISKLQLQEQTERFTNQQLESSAFLSLSLSLCFVCVIVISTNVVPSATTISATKWRHYNNRNRNTKAPLINSEPSTGAIHHARRYEFSQVCNAIANWRRTLLGWETQSDRNSWLDFLLTLSLSSGKIPWVSIHRHRHPLLFTPEIVRVLCNSLVWFFSPPDRFSVTLYLP
jgi:hypothetical protein